MNKIKNIRFTLKKRQIFVVIKKDEVDLIIANKDYTKFRTLDQLVNISGYANVICIDKQKTDSFINNDTRESGFALSTGEPLISATDSQFRNYFYYADKAGYSSLVDLLKFKEYLERRFEKTDYEQAVKESQENTEKYLNF